MVSFNDLPDEIVLKIFKYCSVFDLHLQFKYVCSRWETLAEDPTLYDEILINDEVFSKDVKYLFEKYDKVIKRLFFIRRNDLEELISYIKDCVNLEFLRIEQCVGCDKYYIENFKNCQKFSTLIIRNSEFISSNLFKILKDRDMNRLNIRNVSEDMLEENFLWLVRTKHLTLKNVKVISADITKFCRSNFDNLTTLKLISYNDEKSCDHIDDLYSQDELFFQAICSCQHLKVLCLGHPSISRIDDNIFSYLHKLHLLTSFVLYHAEQVTASGFIQFFSQFFSKNLQKIGLYKCKYANHLVIKTIASNCKNLEKFIFEQNKYTRTVINQEHIIPLMQECSKLKKLYLFGMHIEIANILDVIPSYLDYLETLKYSNNTEPMKIPGVVNTLQKKMPEYEIHVFFGHDMKRKRI